MRQQPTAAAAADSNRLAAVGVHRERRPLVGVRIQTLDRVEKSLAGEAADRVKLVADDGHSHVRSAARQLWSGGPRVRLRIVDLDAAQRARSVAAADRKQFAVVEGGTAASSSRMQRRHVRPLVRLRVISLDDAQAVPEIATADRIHATVEGAHAGLRATVE